MGMKEKMPYSGLYKRKLCVDGGGKESDCVAEKKTEWKDWKKKKIKKYEEQEKLIQSKSL